MSRKVCTKTQRVPELSRKKLKWSQEVNLAEKQLKSSSNPRKQLKGAEVKWRNFNEQKESDRSTVKTDQHDENSSIHSDTPSSCRVCWNVLSAPWRWASHTCCWPKPAGSESVLQEAPNTGPSSSPPGSSRRTAAWASACRKTNRNILQAETLPGLSLSFKLPSSRGEQEESEVSVLQLTSSCNTDCRKASCCWMRALLESTNRLFTHVLCERRPLTSGCFCAHQTPARCPSPSGHTPDRGCALARLGSAAGLYWRRRWTSDPIWGEPLKSTEKTLFIPS